MWLIQLDDVIGLCFTGFPNFATVSARKLDQVVQISMLDPSADRRRPDFIDLMSPTTKCRVHLPNGARSTGVGIRGHIGANQNAKL